METVLQAKNMTKIYGMGSKQPFTALENIDLENARFYNEYNYGSYMLFRGIPVFIDSRADLYAPEFSGNKDEDIFYKTDHHWTSLGVYYAYQEFCKEMGIEQKPLSWYQSEVLSDQFLGTTYSKANLYTVQPDHYVL